MTMSYIKLTLFLSLLLNNFDQTNCSCRNSNECSSFGSRWRAYKFVCCTTVACSDPFRYYLVTSGCTNTNACQQVARVTDSMFAARVHAEEWSSKSNRLYRDCEATRLTLSSVTKPMEGAGPTPDPDVPTAAPQLSNDQAATSFVAIAASVPRDKSINRNPWLSKGSCSRIQSACAQNGETCCVHIRCNSEWTQGGGLKPEYIVQELCSKQCQITTSRSGSSYLFTFPPEEWERRKWYEEDYDTGPLTASCTETRYFYTELKFKQSEGQDNAFSNRHRTLARKVL